MKAQGKSIISLLLGASLASAALLSCGSDTTASTETEAPVPSETKTEQTTEAATENPRFAVKENIPEGVDYGGYAFRIQSRDADHHKKELSADAENGETVNDAVYRRNHAVEDRLNITLVPVYEPEADEMYPIRMIKKNILAAEDYVDLALLHTKYGASLAAEGLFLNWRGLPVVDFTKPWWHSGVNDELTIAGREYLASGDLCSSAIDYAWSMVFNKQMAADHDLEDLYALVNDGKWTIDVMLDMVRSVSADLNGDGTFDESDRYGFVTHNNSAVVNWMFALGQKVTEMNADGIPELVLNTERMQTIVEKVHDLMFTGNQTFRVTDGLTSKYNTSHDLMVADMFAENRALFAALRIYVIDHLRSMETDFGIIPYPKFDEKQDTYHTHVDGHAPLMSIPNTIKDPERTGVIVESLCAESYRTVIPAVYDVVLTEKYARDEMSVHMLDLILNGRQQNFGYVYESGDMQWSLTNLMNMKSTKFASYYKSHEKRAIKGYDKMVQAHLDIED